jgi:hypothetical protein
LNNKPTSIALSKLSTETKKDLLFSFKYFQIITGELTLPENFVPESINIAAILPKSKWQKYNRIDQSYPWLKSIENITQSPP